MRQNDIKRLFDPPLTDEALARMSPDAREFLVHLSELGVTFPYDHRARWPGEPPAPRPLKARPRSS